jgi:intein/homing endonuclease
MAAKTFADVFTQELAKKPKEALVSMAGSSGLVSLESLFDEIPVGLDVFVRDKKFLGQNITLSPVQAEAIQYMERVYYKDMYSKLGEYEPYWNADIPIKNFLYFQWGKGSKSPDSLIYTVDQGKWVTLRDFRASLVASAPKDTGVVASHMATDSFLEGYGSMYKVTLASGLETIVWEGHKFLSWNRDVSDAGRILGVKASKGFDWKRLWDMEVGDHVAVSSYVPEPTNTVQVDSREVELVGLWIGDGCMPLNRGDRGPTMAIGYKSPVLLHKYKSLGESYGLKHTVQDDPKQHKVTVTLTNGRSSNTNPVREVCFKWGLNGKRAATKRIPEEFFSLPNDQIVLLLSRLIDTDGWLTSVSNTCEIGYGSISKGLVEDIQKLLLRLGVLAEVKQKNTTYKDKPYTSYQLRVRKSEMVERLASQLTLLDKEEKRLEVLDRVKNVTRRNAMHGDLVWDRVKSIEYLYEGEYWTTTVEGPACYISDGGFLDHNSGKDSVCRLGSLRIAYLLMCLKSPQAYFGMPEDDNIHMLNVAMSATQAQNAFFSPLKKNVSRGWFKDRTEPTKSEIHYDKGIIGISGHSETESQEGNNLILGVLDEIDGFKTKAELARFQGASVRDSSKSAEAIMEMVGTSGSTRFPETHKMVCISFPRYLGSTIQKLCAEGRKDIEDDPEGSPYYVSGPLATWEVNPTKKKWMFLKDYKKDPIAAAAKYECNPTYASNPYYSNALAVENCFSDRDPIKIDYVYNGSVWEPSYEFSENFYPVQGAIYAMHADMAVTGDRAGIALAHVVRRDSVEKEIFGENGELIRVTDMLPYVKVDFVIGFEADLTSAPAREIQIRWARDLWAELKLRGFNIRQFSFDGFQSLESRQELERLGVNSPRLSTDLTEEHWKGLRDLMYGSRVSLPYSDILASELLSLTRRSTGKVDHVASGSKDFADALACACTGAIMMGGQESVTGDRAYYAAPEFVIGDNVAPELRMLEHDPMNIVFDEMDFDTPLSTEGWGDLSSSGGLW